MGIPNLLQSLQFCAHKASITDYANQTLAIDVSCWLHRSVYAIAPHYVQHPTSSQSFETSLSYIRQRCQELKLGAQCKAIVLVLDGVRCPKKAVTHVQRQKRRDENLQKALSLTGKAAEKAFQACITISTEFAIKVVHAVKLDYVSVVQAPYEADAQLVYLAEHGEVRAIITEDSDVLVYAAACQSSVPILFKLNRHSGACQVIRGLDWYHSKNPATPRLQTQLQALRRLPLEEAVIRWIRACIHVGCDYHEQSRVSLPKALASAETFSNHEFQQCEAIFYLHPVRHKQGHIVWLNEDQTTLLEPFNDYSFLGNYRQEDDRIILLDPLKKETKRTNVWYCTTQKRSTHNPYAPKRTNEEKQSTKPAGSKARPIEIESKNGSTQQQTKSVAIKLAGGKTLPRRSTSTSSSYIRATTLSFTKTSAKAKSNATRKSSPQTSITAFLKIPKSSLDAKADTQRKRPLQSLTNQSPRKTSKEFSTTSPLVIDDVSDVESVPSPQILATKSSKNEKSQTRKMDARPMLSFNNSMSTSQQKEQVETSRFFPPRRITIEQEDRFNDFMSPKTKDAILDDPSPQGVKSTMPQLSFEIKKKVASYTPRLRKEFLRYQHDEAAKL